MDCSTPGSSVLHCFLEFVQIHVHWVSDAIQPSHPLPPPSLLAFSLSRHQDLFQWVGSLPSDAQGTGASASVLSMIFQGRFPFRLTDLISLLSNRLSGVFSSTTVWRHQFFGTPPSLQSALTTIHDHREDHILNYMDIHITTYKIDNKGLLYSTGKSAQYSVMAYMVNKYGAEEVARIHRRTIQKRC